MDLKLIADELTREGIFTGGPPQFFEIAGRLQMATLIREGMRPESKLLDIGCGCLRAGYWLIRFLDPDCYYGIEPAKQMLERGIELVLTPEIQEAKRPRFDTNDRFDFSVFGSRFDIFLARSIWTHASKRQIEAMLDSFVATANPNAFFLTSFYPAVWFGRRGSRDYKGEAWVGRSHERSRPGQIHHSHKWIREAARRRGLQVRELDYGVFSGQHWLKIAGNPAVLVDSGFSIG